VLLFLNTFLSGPVAPRTSYNNLCIYSPHQAYNTLHFLNCTEIVPLSHQGYLPTPHHLQYASMQVTSSYELSNFSLYS